MNAYHVYFTIMHETTAGAVFLQCSMSHPIVGTSLLWEQLCRADLIVLSFQTQYYVIEEDGGDTRRPVICSSRAAEIFRLLRTRASRHGQVTVSIRKSDNEKSTLMSNYEISRYLHSISLTTPQLKKIALMPIYK